jgi:hypothetical protein
MKRAALCFRGAVSVYPENIHSMGKLLKADDLYKNKNYINVEAIHNSLKQHLIQTNSNVEFDVFLHCWNTDLQERLCSIYNPKSYLFEDNTIYKSEISKRAATEKHYAMPSQFLSIKKSLELMENYKNSLGIEYDYIILFRYDVLLMKDIHLGNYDVTKYVYSNDLLFAGITKAVGDLYFISSPDHVSFLKGWYDDLLIYPGSHIHLWLNKQFARYNIHLKKDLMTTFTVDIIRRIHPNLIKVGDYGLSQDDINKLRINTHSYFYEYTIFIIILSALIMTIKKRTIMSFILYVIEFYSIAFLLSYFYPYYSVSLLLLILLVIQIRFI